MLMLQLLFFFFFLPTEPERIAPSAAPLPVLAAAGLLSAGQRLQQLLPASLSAGAAEPASGGRTASGLAHLEDARKVNTWLNIRFPPNYLMNAENNLYPITRLFTRIIVRKLD